MAAQEAAPLRKGMLKYEVLAALGQPKDIGEIYHETESAEVWTYQREKVDRAYDVEVQKRAYNADIRTGAVVEGTETIVRAVDEKSVITLELLFHGDTLIAFKEKVEEGSLGAGRL